jgi:hypothetical protein
MTETVDQAQAQPPRALAGVIEDATSLSFVPASHFGGSRRWPPCLTAMPYSGKAVTSGSAIPYTTSVDVSLPTHCGHLQQFAGHWRGVPRDAYRVRGTRQGCRADILPGQRSALMPKCSMNHACGPATTQAITAPSCVTSTAATSKPFAARPESDCRRACRHLPLLTTVRLLQVRVEPELGWLLRRR